jgi:hypothetical protein
MNLCAALVANNPAIALDAHATAALDASLETIGDNCTGVLHFLQTNDDPQTGRPFANNYNAEALAAMASACADLSQLANDYANLQSNSAEAGNAFFTICYVVTQQSVYDPINHGFPMPVIPAAFAGVAN